MKKVSLSEGIRKKALENEEKCVGCNLCMKECPMSLEVKNSPKSILKDIKESGSIDASIPYSCTFCNSCTSKCPKDIDLSNMYNNIRTDVFNKDKKLVKSFGYSTVKFHQKNSFSSIFTGKYMPKDCDTVFFPGCSLAGYSSKLVLNTFNYLSNNIENIGLLQICCGKPSLDIGDNNTFKDNFQGIIDILKKNNIKKVIVACSNCFNTIRDYSDVEVISLWEVLKGIGVPESIKNAYSSSSLDVALHDPCPIRKESNIHESVRFILEEIGLDFKEFNRNKDKTQCCGAGGMMMCTNKNVALKQMNNRANSTDASHIVSYCESCVQSMLTGGKKGLHILDLIFSEEVISGKVNTQEGKGVISHWLERRKSAKNPRKLIQKK